MGRDDKIHNPVEEYMSYIMDRDKPDKPPETTTALTKHLEIKKDGDDERSNTDGGSRQEALKVADAIKQSVNIRRNSDEERIFDIKRHPIGLVLLLLVVIIGYSIAFSLIGFLLPGFADITGSELGSIGPVAGISMVAAFLLGVIYLSLKARNYRLNRLVLTDFNIVHVLQSGLLGKKVAKLPVSDVENVVIQKNGLFPSIFNYGTIIIETSEERDNFIFEYAPDPDSYAKAVRDSKLEYLANYSLPNL